MVLSGGSTQWDIVWIMESIRGVVQCRPLCTVRLKHINSLPLQLVSTRVVLVGGGDFLVRTSCIILPRKLSFQLDSGAFMATPQSELQVLSGVSRGLAQLISSAKRLLPALYKLWSTRP